MTRAPFSRPAPFALALLASACGTLLSVDDGPPAAPAATDASTSDGAAATDASTGGCSVRFCCDFDQATPCSWSGERGSATDVSFTIDGRQAVSPPNALHLATSGDETEATRMLFVDAAGATKATADLQLRLDPSNPGDSSSVHPVEITCNDKVAVALKLKSSGALVLGGGSLSDTPIVDTFPPGTFVPVRLEVQRVGTDLDARASAAVAGAREVTNRFPCEGDVRVHVGARVVGGKGAYALSFDDVRIDWP